MPRTNIATRSPKTNNGKGAQPPRMSAAVRQAIEEIATLGKTQTDAAKAAGMSKYALSRALARPGVREHLEARKLAFVSEVNALHETAKKRAILVGLELMEPGNPATVRARMVEFFAREREKTGVSVNISQNFGGGYEYLPPNAQVIDIAATDVTPTDPQSDGSEDEGPTE